MMRKKFLALGLILGILTGIVGCSDSSNDAVGGNSSAASKDEKVWVIACDTAYKPFEFTDEKGNFVGIEVDLLAALAEDQGFKYDLQPLGWDSALAAAQAGQADAVIGCANITEERLANGWIFSDPYYENTWIGSVALNSDITGLEDLKGKTVAAKSGSAATAYVESIKDQYGFNIIYFQDGPTVYQAVIGGQADLFFEDTPIIKSSIKNDGLQVKVLENTETEGTPAGLITFNDSSSEFLELFNAGLKHLQDSGELDRIFAKWLD